MDIRVFSVLLILCLHANALMAQQTTWSEDIACIVFNGCSPCHNDNGIAPFSLTDYQEVYDRRFEIQEAILNKRMPPWMPDPSHQRFVEERHLSDAEINAIDVWIQSGAESGDLSKQPPLPTFVVREQIEDPDFSIRVPNYEVPDGPDIDLYRCFVFDHNLLEDRFISEIEIIPSDPSLVHHVLVFQDATGITTTLDDQDPDPGYVCFGGVGSDDAEMIAGWAPGAGPVKMPTGFGVRLKKESRLVIQLHYPAGNAGKIDDTKINIKYREKGVASREILILPVLNHFTSMLNGPLSIKAGERKTFRQLFHNPFHITVTAIAPHAHLVCESMKAYGITPTGDTIEFIDIPHWDFEWQGFYQLQKPIVVPPGTAIYGEASYNNTSVNHHLPYDIPRDVQVGEATTDEMMVFFFGFSSYEQGDENLVFDTSDLSTQINNCQETITTALDEPTKAHFTVHPNPSSGTIVIQGQGLPREALLDLYSCEGKLVARKRIEGNQVSIEELKGVFIAKITGDHGSHYRPVKVVLY